MSKGKKSTTKRAPIRQKDSATAAFSKQEAPSNSQSKQPTFLTRRHGNQRWSPRGHILKSLALASRPQKLACPRLEDSTSFWIVKILWSAWKIFWKTCFRGDRLKNNFCEDLVFYLESTCACVLGLGPAHSCPWPWECLSSERLSLALASDFFCVLGLGLEPCVLDSTSDGNIASSSWLFFNFCEKCYQQETDSNPFQLQHNYIPKCWNLKLDA